MQHYLNSMRRAALLFIVIISFLKADSQSAKIREHYSSEVVFYTQKIKEEPENITNYYARATFYHILCNFSASRNDFIKVIELYFAQPNKKFERVATDACYFLADDYYFRNSDRANAQAYIAKGLSITPGDIRFEVLQTGLLGTYPDKQEEAEKRFEALIAKYPSDEKIALYYAKFLERKNPQRSTELYERVVTIDPGNIDALFALGAYYTNEASRIYKEKGDAGKVLAYTNKSVAYFEKVHQMNPDDKEIIEILIQCYGNLNRNADKKRMEKELNR